VPASGAASRMFKNLYNFLETYDESDESYNKLIADNSFNSAHNFFNSLLSFAFYSDLMNIILVADGEDLEELLMEKDFIYILSALLTEEGLNYGNLPKALLKFHRYDNQYSRTPIEEHLVEGAHYTCNTNKQVPIHFTVSPEHKELFKEHIAKVKEIYERRFDVKFDISYSEQKQSTDTIAVDLQNNPFRNSDGSLLFRPGGHGALIENLNEMNADIVFIKNIDNVVPDKLKEATIRYKKLLAGCLIHYQNKIAKYLTILENTEEISEEKISEMIDFLQSTLCVSLEKVTFKSRVDKILVCNPTYVAKKQGAKTDFRDALHLANELRGGHLKEVFHDDSHWGQLRTSVSGYLDIVSEIIRFKNRLKAVFRVRKIKVS